MVWYGPGGATEDLFPQVFLTFKDSTTLTKADGTILQNFELDWHSERFTSIGEIVEGIGVIETDQWGEFLRSDGFRVGDFPAATSGPRSFGTIQLSDRTFTIRGVSSSESHIRLHCDKGRDNA